MKSYLSIQAAYHDCETKLLMTVQLSIAPGGACRFKFVTKSTVVSYSTLSPLPVHYNWRYVSVALSLGLLQPDVIRHPALWSPDFPRGHCPRDYPVFRTKSF